MSLLQKASIITTPTAYAEDFLYNIKPAGGLGNELITNGSFDTDTNWVKGTGWAISGGKASNDGSQSSTSEIYQTGVVVIGKTYKLVYDIVDYTSGTVRIRCGNTFDVTNNAIGTYTAFLTATSNGGVGIQASADFIGSIDNVSVKEVADFDFDRNSTGTRVNEDYLIEDVPYNIMNYSQDYSHWNTQRSSLSTDFFVAPDNTKTARGLIASTDNDDHALSETLTNLMSNQQYTFSFFVKKADGNKDFIRL